MRARATIHYMNFKSVYIFTYICFAEYSQGCRLGFLLFFSHFPRPLFYYFLSLLFIHTIVSIQLLLSIVFLFSFISLLSTRVNASNVYYLYLFETLACKQRCLKGNTNYKLVIINRIIVNQFLILFTLSPHLSVSFSSFFAVLFVLP